MDCGLRIAVLKSKLAAAEQPPPEPSEPWGRQGFARTVRREQDALSKLKAWESAQRDVQIDSDTSRNPNRKRRSLQQRERQGCRAVFSPAAACRKVPESPSNTGKKGKLSIAPSLSFAALGRSYGQRGRPEEAAGKKDRQARNSVAKGCTAAATGLPTWKRSWTRRVANCNRRNPTASDGIRFVVFSLAHAVHCAAQGSERPARSPTNH